MRSGIWKRRIQRPRRGDEHVRIERSHGLLHTNGIESKVLQFVLSSRKHRGRVSSSRVPDRFQQRTESDLVAIGDHAGGHSVSKSSQFDVAFA